MSSVVVGSVGSVKQVAKQAAFGVSQEKLPGQGPEGCEQPPEPLHIPAAVVRVEPTHVGGVTPQVVALLALAHMPPESHLPVFPQTFPLGFVQAPSGVSSVTGEHVPSEPLTLQA